MYIYVRLILVGNIILIGLSFKQTFSKLFRPTNAFLSIEIILFDSSHTS
jgi:hypothetical protein